MVISFVPAAQDQHIPVVFCARAGARREGDGAKVARRAAAYFVLLVITLLAYAVPRASLDGRRF